MVPWSRVPTKLSVNLNKIATLRNTRSVGLPSVTRCAALCIEAGAEGITVHPRPDQRHILPSDVSDLAALLREHPSVEFNIEGNPFHGLLEYAASCRPTQCTLVPDTREQATSDHGWNLRDESELLRPVVGELKRLGCRVSVFVDARPEIMPIARDVGADRVELYTEPYATAFRLGDATAELAAFRRAASAAHSAGLGVNAGHDLNQENLGPFLANVPDVLEVSIGHALIADALQYGLANTVRRYLAVIRRR